MIAAGPYLLANGNLSALEELLRRADNDPSIETLILVCWIISNKENDPQTKTIFSLVHLLMNDHLMYKIYKIKLMNNFLMKLSRK